MVAQEMPLRKRKRQQFLFDEFKSGVLSEEYDNILVGAPRGQLIISKPAPRLKWMAMKVKLN